VKPPAPPAPPRRTSNATLRAIAFRCGHDVVDAVNAAIDAAEPATIERLSAALPSSRALREAAEAARTLAPARCDTLPAPPDDDEPPPEAA
jgi:hypothetical protein